MYAGLRALPPDTSVFAELEGRVGEFPHALEQR
jgi:hypothetical protein